MLVWSIWFACLLASSHAGGVYVIDYLERNIADTFNVTNETEAVGDTGETTYLCDKISFKHSNKLKITFDDTVHRGFTSILHILNELIYEYTV